MSFESEMKEISGLSDLSGFSDSKEYDPIHEMDESKKKEISDLSDFYKERDETLQTSRERTNFSFILRTISQEECFNFSLGSCFSLIARDEQFNRFRALFKEVFGRDHVADLDESSDYDTRSVNAFLIDEKDEIHVLRQTDSNYIMNQDGKTFLTVNK